MLLLPKSVRLAEKPDEVMHPFILFIQAVEEQIVPSFAQCYLQKQ